MIEGALTGFLGMQGRYIGGPPLDPDALDWRARVLAAGGTVSTSTLVAVSLFCQGCKSDAIWAKLGRVNLFCGGELTACLVPLKVGSGGATDANTNFVAGDYTETGVGGGLKGNGSSKCLDTGLAQSAFTAGDRHIGVYECAKSTKSYDTSIGSGTNAGFANFWGLGTQATAADYIYFSSQSAVGPTLSTYTSAGAHLCGVGSSTTAKLYVNGVSAGSAVPSGTTPTPSALTQFLFAINRSGTPTEYTDARLGGYHVGTGLSATEAESLYTRIQAFQTALGRQV